MSRLLKIVSGGQTGVDRAALDAALELSIPCGGWCPRGRRAEDGPIARRYPLVESETAAYAERTLLNVRDADATLVLCRGAPAGGTELTVQFAKALERPHLAIDLAAGNGEAEAARVRGWIAERAVAVLNVAGPRESSAPGIGDEARLFLHRVLA